MNAQPPLRVSHPAFTEGELGLIADWRPEAQIELLRRIAALLELGWSEARACRKAFEQIRAMEGDRNPFRKVRPREERSTPPDVRRVS